MPRRLLVPLVAFAALVGAGCRVEVGVDVAMEQNGSGNVTVTITADADIVAQAPGLAEDLRFDDLIEAGWTVDGPTDTPAGGLSVVLDHGFYTPEQATALLASLNGTGGPLKAVALGRDAGERAIRYTITGSARATGLEAFADADLIAAVGATPYLADVTAAGLTDDDVVGFAFSAALPGEVLSTTSGADAAPLSWSVPLDDTAVDLSTTTEHSLERGGVWNVLAGISLVALIAWIAASALFIALVMRARSRRRRRPSRRSEPEPDWT